MSPFTLHFRTYGTLIARILMGGLFLLAGINKLKDVAGTAGYIESTWLPVPVLLAWLTILVEILLGAALILGYKASKAAFGLAVFTILATLIFHEFMDMSFVKNLGVLGGLLYMIAYGPGEGWSLASKEAAPVSTPEPEKTPDQDFTV